ncbi:MAG TPA: alpha/beta hydrolase [Xanthobacteraceae bacterium]|nr:alpha/beta hydrolase [Xanthobacteraceae bacterium]
MDLVSIPANPVPDGATVGMLQTPDGVHLRFARWQPPAGRKGTVCVFPGRAEFIEKYFEVVSDARARGFAVAVLDWRGQGRSERATADIHKGYVRRFAGYDLDLDTFVKEVVLPDCPPPLFALGHSMGGTVLLRAAYRGRRWFDRMVLSAPMVALAGRSGSRGAKITARTLRYLGMGGAYVPGGSAKPVATRPFIGNPVTSDSVRYARTAAIVEADPDLGLGSPSVAWVDAAFRAMRDFAEPAYPAHIRQPMLIVAAGQDELVSTPAIAQFAVRLRAGAHLVISGSRHEILMEQDHFRSQFWAAFDAFVPGSPLFG